MRHIVAVLAGIALLVGCTTQDTDKAGNPDKPLAEPDQKYEDDQIPRIRETVDVMREAIVAGDTKTYFERLSMAQRETYGGYDAFVRQYTANQNGWREMWRGAEIRRIAIDEHAKEKASVQIRWSTPAPSLVEFVLEDGTWRFHYVVP